MKNIILLSNGYLPHVEKSISDDNNFCYLATILSNMAYYGYVPNKDVYETLKTLSNDKLVSFWKELESSFKKITFADKNMDSVVVYKNFPREVLEMSRAQYWIAQVLMYIGFPNEIFTEEKVERPILNEKKNLKVLSFAKETVFSDIYSSLLASTKVWTDQEKEFAVFLFSELKNDSFDFGDVNFKENAVLLANKCIEKKININVNDATDVLRIANFMQHGVVRFNSYTKFSTFSQPVRKQLLSMLEGSKHLEQDIAMNPVVWKRFFMYLRPASYKNRFPRSVKAYDLIYNSRYEKSIYSQLDALLSSITPSKEVRCLKRRPLKKKKAVERKEAFVYNPEEVSHSLGDSMDSTLKEKLYSLKAEQVWKEEEILIDKPSVQEEAAPVIDKMINKDEVLHEVKRLLIQRPNEAIKRFHHIYSLFGKEVVSILESALPTQSVQQLLEFKGYIKTINDRKYQFITPSGQWQNAKIFKNEKAKIKEDDQALFVSMIDNQLAKILLSVIPNGVDLCEETKNIKLKANGQELATYGQGTIFDIPENTQFIRSGSYWAFPNDNHCNIWYDNCWAFFDEKMNKVNHCDWTNERVYTQVFECDWFSHDNRPDHNLNCAAVFSGDPTISKDEEGKGCQMIDLYLDKLREIGVRYAVWSLLGYSRKKFSEAKEVIASLQFGEDAEKGNIYEPSRAQMVFPVIGDNLSKYLVMIDLVDNKMIYLDANLPADVMSPASNMVYLEDAIPALMERINSKPSVYDVFENAPKGDMKVVFSDKEVDLEDDVCAYVFKKENENNKFSNFDLETMLEAKINS